MELKDQAVTTNCQIPAHHTQKGFQTNLATVDKSKCCAKLLDASGRHTPTSRSSEQGVEEHTDEHILHIISAVFVSGKQI